MSNVKSDASKLPNSSDKAEILKQVEFYFSDENLPTDKFLWKTSQANNGWVPIATIHSFKRMRRFQPEEAVIEALQSSEVLEVEDGKVRRKVPLKEPNPEEKKGAFARTVYAKGFGAETETTQFDVEKFFGEFGETKQVRLRRADDGTFKGSVFVEFADASDSEKFLAATPKWNDEELLVMSKQAYTDMKAAEHGFSNNANGKRRRFNAFKEKPKRQQNRRQQPNKRQQNKRPRNEENEKNDENDEGLKKAKGDSGAEIEAEKATANLGENKAAEVAETAN